MKWNLVMLLPWAPAERWVEHRGSRVVGKQGPNISGPAILSRAASSQESAIRNPSIFELSRRVLRTTVELCNLFTWLCPAYAPCSFSF